MAAKRGMDPRATEAVDAQVRIFHLFETMFS